MLLGSGIIFHDAVVGTGVGNGEERAAGLEGIGVLSAFEEEDVEGLGVGEAFGEDTACCAA